MPIAVSPPVRQTQGGKTLDANTICCFVYTASSQRLCFWHGIAPRSISAANCRNEWSGAETSVTITKDHRLPVQGWGNSIPCS
ncbi:hypothetical protein CORC01_12764 [Colletotrichum orchidophilum]|uniref:Uncharacterized protein n=1 Tax=Colletotrichum orchidophilum TaxID=1209926 RepID=A0A1G4ARW4_9PEZI|nr:uncharacterized protein CORC01_12764 [Colletotrichum orchidophilum]OHE91914.1 hypothetical protein CORC01_12764 [Colletotrichum orchidophilum]